MSMKELDGISAIDDLFGIAGLQEDLMDAGVLVTSAGISAWAGGMAFKKINALATLDWYYKAGIALVAGVAGGMVVGRYVHRGAGAGIVAGLGGLAIAETVKQGYRKFVDPTDSDPQMNDRIGQMDRDLLLGTGDLGATLPVREINVLPGQDPRLAGLGQAGRVGSRDLQPMPGGGFADDLAALVA